MGTALVFSSCGVVGAAGSIAGGTIKAAGTVTGAVIKTTGNIISGIIGGNDGEINAKGVKYKFSKAKVENDGNMTIVTGVLTNTGSRKEKTNTELLEKILKNNLGQTKFFINKAIGWALRDYSKTNPEWVKNFIEEIKENMAKLSIKEASKYL